MLKSWFHNIKKMYRSEKNMFKNAKCPTAFTLIEVMVAISVLGAITASVLVVMNRCIAAAIDNQMKMQAFELARENMEQLLASDTVSDMAEFGVSDTNPDIEWRTVVETFNEPITSKPWLQAVCSVSYIDSKGEEQTIELTHWLTSLTMKQQQQIQEQKQRESQYMEQFGPDEKSDDQYDLQFDDISVEKTIEMLQKLLQQSRETN